LEKVNFFPLNFWFVTNTREVMEHFKLLFGSGNSDLAKIRPLKNWTSWISPWVPPYGILPRATQLTYAWCVSGLKAASTL
jgi:hypothetical protein